MKKEDFVVPILKFEIISAQIIGGPKKYVSYTILIKKNSHVEDEHPCQIDRRYSDFLELFTKLRQEFPDIFTSLAFPKKAVFGNFSSEMISFRKTGFESLLLILAQNEKVRESSSVVDFFQKKEKREIDILVAVEHYSEAIVLLEINFRLLNKLFTDRHPRVLQVLCLLVACCEAARSTLTLQYAQTAVCRFESVSDTDSLRYYVPLLQLCVKIMSGPGSSPYKETLQERLDCMKTRGIRVAGCPPLLDAVFADYKSKNTDT